MEMSQGLSLDTVRAPWIIDIFMKMRKAHSIIRGNAVHSARNERKYRKCIDIREKKIHLPTAASDNITKILFNILNGDELCD